MAANGAAPPFQSLILDLQRFWADKGCVVLQPYDMEVYELGKLDAAKALREELIHPVIFLPPDQRQDAC